MKKPAIVLYPTAAVGHLISMVELGKLILTHHPSLSIHVLITSLPFDAGATAPYISSVSSSTTQITFHHLPTAVLPPDFSTSSPHHETLAFEVLRLNNPNVRRSLEYISETHSVDALISDFFCACVAPVARNLGIPCYFFFTAGGGTLALFLHLPILHDSTTDQSGSEQEKRKSMLHVPGLPPFPLLDMPKPCQDRNDPAYQFFLDSSRKMSLSTGIIVNTFDALELRAVETIRRGDCRSGEGIPIFCIGPLVSSHNGGNHHNSH